MAEQKEYLTIRIARSIKRIIEKLAKQERRTPSSVAAILLEQSIKEEDMEKKFMARQGDVLIHSVDRLPIGKRKKRASGEILEGETTGHIHRILQLDQAEVLEIGNGLFVSVGENGVSLVHEEHAPILLPPGDYEITRQREYSPEAIRNVAD